MDAASGASITSVLSAASVTRSAIRRLVLARMSARPRRRTLGGQDQVQASDRPRCAMPTSR